MLSTRISDTISDIESPTPVKYSKMKLYHFYTIDENKTSESVPFHVTLNGKKTKTTQKSLLPVAMARYS